MTENTFTIPAQTRTIFVDFYGTKYKYKLNLPEFSVIRNISLVNGKTRWNIFATYAGQIYWPPLLNVNDAAQICLGSQILSNSEFVNALFCTYFNIESVGCMRKYVKFPGNFDCNYYKTVCLRVNKFYKNYEKSGTIKLVEV